MKMQPLAKSNISSYRRKASWKIETWAVVLDISRLLVSVHQEHHPDNDSSTNAFAPLLHASSSTFLHVRASLTGMTCASCWVSRKPY